MAVLELEDVRQRKSNGVLLLLKMWLRTYRTRRDLKAASEHLLKDVGLSPEQAQYEARRPFWQSDL